MISEKLLLKVYELKKKFRYLIYTNSQKNTVGRDLSSCIMEKFSGHKIFRKLRENGLRLEFKPINIVDEPVKHFKRKINCFFTDKISLAYRTKTFRTSSKFEYTNDYECLSYSTFFLSKNCFEKHLKKSSRVPGILYRFENQSLVTFEDNYEFRGDSPFAAYFDFETTTTASSGIKLEVSEIFPITCDNFCFPSKTQYWQNNNLTELFSFFGEINRHKLSNDRRAQKFRFSHCRTAAWLRS